MDKILVVDDEPDTVNLAKTILEEAGYRVECASDGDAALKTVETTSPDLILLDVVMPGTSGLQVCKILKDRSSTKQTPIIMFTAFDRPADRKLTHDVGADAHLVKTLAKETLLTQIDRSLRKAKSQKFSSQLGIDHDQLLGRKILVEFDPRTNYEKIVRDFAFECRSHHEAVIILSQAGGAIEQTLEGEDGIRFVHLDTTVKFSPLLNENNGGELSFVVDNLTDLALSRSEDEAYRFAQNSLRVLATPKVTAIYLVNPLAHDEKAIASLRGLYGNQLTYENSGMNLVRFAASHRTLSPLAKI